MAEYTKKTKVKYPVGDDGETLVDNEEMMKFAQLRAADKRKTMKNKDPRLTDRTRTLMSDPEFYKKYKLK